MFLAFGMQMCLVLVTGHAAASSRPVRALIDRLAALPHTTAQAALLVAAAAMVAAVVNWGLGLILGALLARDVGRALQRRGVAAHYPLLCAAGYMGLLVWHGGLSGSAPLAMSTLQGAAKVLPPEALGQLDAGVPLGATLGSMLNLVVTGGLLLGIPLVLALLAPGRDEDIRTIDAYDVHEARVANEAPPTTLPERLERSPIVAWLLVLPIAAALWRRVAVEGAGRVDLNTVNLAMLALGLALHGSPLAYMRAITEAARGCAGIIIQFPLYAGIAALMQAAGLVEMIAELFARMGSERTAPLLSFLSAGIVNLFVPSGGGQWGLQGPVALETGMALGVVPGRMIMAVAYGDQLTNMLQPFWALPLLGITGVKAREIVGYTTIAMLAAGAWMAAWLLLL
jgi:short-chain fatty acids transporter